MIGREKINTKIDLINLGKKKIPRKCKYDKDQCCQCNIGHRNEPFSSDRDLAVPLNASRNYTLICSLAYLTGSTAKCAYRCVVGACLWPKRVPSIGKLKPSPAPMLA